MGGKGAGGAGITAVGAPGNRRGLIALLLCIVPLSQFPIDVYTPAIPDMVRDLGTTESLIQGSIAAFVLGLAVGQIPVGVMSDAWGRRRVLLASLAVLALASLGTGFSQDVWTLLVFRFLEGIGGCGCMVLTFAIAADIAKGPRLAALSGWLGATWGLAPVVAPAIGGMIVQWGSWPWIFWLVAALLWLPETLGTAEREPIVPRAIGSVIGHALVNRIFLLTVLAFGIFGGVQILFNVTAPLLYQVDLGFQPAAYGFIALLVGGANLLGEMTTGGLATRVSHARIAGWALASFSLGALVLLVGGLVVGVSPWLIAIGGCLCLYGAGTICPLMFARAVGMHSRNLGLIAGVTSAITYLIIAATSASAAALPDHSQVPLGIVFVVVAVVAGGLFLVILPWRGTGGAAGAGVAAGADAAGERVLGGDGGGAGDGGPEGTGVAEARVTGRTLRRGSVVTSD